MDSYKAAYVLQQIADAAQWAIDALDLGYTTATILAANGLIDAAVRDIVTGKL